MTSKNITLVNQPNQTTWCINVTDLTSNQRHQVFKDAINQNGFTGFIKYQGKNNNQTHYAFIYSK